MTDLPTASWPPGWYPDPNDLPTLRWYNGDRWTEQLAPMSGTARQPLIVQAAKKSWAKSEVPFTIKIIFVVLVVFVVVAIVTHH
jgi:hypothetical protein